MFNPKPLLCDLNIPAGPFLRETCEKALQLGYEVLGINTGVVAKQCLGLRGPPRGKKRRLEERLGGALSSGAAATPTGLLPHTVPPWLPSLQEKHPGAKLLQRLTVIFSEVADLQAVLNQPTAKLYDIIAVVPTNHEALQSCIISTSLIFDIIAFDFEGPHWINKIRLNKLKGKVAAEKDVYFELNYAPSFHGDEPCENMIYTAKRLTEDVCTRRIKNIVITSGASKPSELRSPKDVISLGYLLGLDETTSRFCIREYPYRCVTKSGR